jgi:prevent-host-death family protein
MVQATIFEAKTTLSNLVKQVRKGEQVLITSGRGRVPVAQLVGVRPVEKKRLGVLESPDFTLPGSFFEPLPEEEFSLWEGKSE